MTTFWLIAAAMAVIAAAVILIPLLSEHAETSVSRDRINARIFRERLAELDSDLQEQRLDKTQYRQLRSELERTLLTDVPQTAAQQSATRATLGVKLAAIAVLLIPAAALVYYHQTAFQGATRNWLVLEERFGKIADLAVHRPTDLPQAALDDLPAFTRVLQAKVLREGLDDPDSLFLLGISYLQLNQPQLAEQPLARANQIDPRQTDYQVAYAQALILVNEGRLTAASSDLLQAVLRVEPDHQGALMLLGFGSFHAGDYTRAIDSWRPLLAMRDPDSESAQLLRASIDQAEKMLAESSNTPTALPVATAAPVASGTAEILVSVSLAPELQSQVASGDTLFVFAKAASGPPMPLAVVREPAGKLPLEVVLSDEQGMSPALKLSDFDQVVVSARISKSGNATAQPDDVQGPAVTVDLSGGRPAVALVIGGEAAVRDTVAETNAPVADKASAPESVATPAPADAAPARLTVNIETSPALRERISAQDTLFVFAKAAAGPPMPLAVAKLPAIDFPVAVVLDDSQAMMPSMKLSDFSEVVVTARISRTGNASAQPGDLQGISPTLSLSGEQSVSLIIDEIVQ